MAISPLENPALRPAEPHTLTPSHNNKQPRKSSECARFAAVASKQTHQYFTSSDREKRRKRIRHQLQHCFEFGISYNIASSQVMKPAALMARQALRGRWGMAAVAFLGFAAVTANAQAGDPPVITCLPDVTGTTPLGTTIEIGYTGVALATPAAGYRTLSTNRPLLLVGPPGLEYTERFYAYQGLRQTGFYCEITLRIIETPPCVVGSGLCGDPHMAGLRGQSIDWSGDDGGWYCLVKDEEDDLHINVRVTAPLREEFPDRQLVTGISVLSGSHSLVVEVKDPYSVSTNGCPEGISPCLADGGLRFLVDGMETAALGGPTRGEFVADGMTMSASNLPVECWQFGGAKIWARMYEEMLEGKRELVHENFEDWILSFGGMAAPDWCARFIALHGLAEVQSSYSAFKISTVSSDIRLHAGISHQGKGELDWDGHVLPELDFWQMDVGIDGLSLDNGNMSGLLGETARPVVDENGHEVMHGQEALRGSVEDYRVAGALGTDFALLRGDTLHK